MRFSRKETIVTIFLTLACTMLYAQQVRVKASVNRDRILIGEPIVLQLEAELPEGESFTWFRLDSVDHFEWLVKGQMDTLDAVQGKLYRQQVTITSFDSGSWTIPRLSLQVKNSSYLTDSIPLTVGYSNADPNKPYHDIRDIIEVPAAETGKVNYIIAIVTLLAIAGLIYLLTRKKKEQVTASIPKGPVLTAYERALSSLSALKPRLLQSNGHVKNLYIELNDIIRDYFREEKLVLEPDSTNDQLVVGIKRYINKEQAIRLAQSLRLVDAVKFAKYQPTSGENEEVLNSVQHAIEGINESIHQKQTN